MSRMSKEEREGWKGIFVGLGIVALGWILFAFVMLAMGEIQ